MNQRGGLHRYACAEQYTCQLRREGQQSCIGGPGGNCQHMYALRFVFVPKGTAELQHVVLGGVI